MGEQIPRWNPSPECPTASPAERAAPRRRRPSEERGARERTPLQEPPLPGAPECKGRPQDSRRVVGPKGEGVGLPKGEEVLGGAKTLDTTMARRPQASAALRLHLPLTPPNASHLVAVGLVLLVEPAKEKDVH